MKIHSHNYSEHSDLLLNNFNNNIISHDNTPKIPLLSYAADSGHNIISCSLSHNHNNEFDNQCPPG